MFRNIDQSHWHFFSPRPWEDLRSITGEKLLPHAVRRKIDNHWQYMNVDEDELSDEMLLRAAIK
jgi:hypothetical protein